MRILTWIIAIAVVVVGGFLAWGNSSKQDLAEDNTQQDADTEAWVDYKNDVYGVSLQYPLEWEAIEALKPQDLRALHDIVFWEREYEMHRASLTVRIFPNDSRQTVSAWWQEWLAEEDIKKQECIDEYGESNAPCLFLRDLVENESATTLGGMPAHMVRLFRFDSEEECIFAARGEYIYGVCYDGDNPNDTDFESNKKITEKMRNSFSFHEPTAPSMGIAELIVGNWQSAEDQSYYMNIETGGAVTELYADDAVNRGLWEVRYADDGAHLSKTLNGEVFEYIVLKVSSEKLVLSYLPRGNTLEFVRVK